MTSRPVSRRALVLPGSLVLVLVGLVAVAAMQWSDRRDSLDQGAVEVGRQHAKNFFSLDYRHPDEEIDAMLELTTDEFREKYESRRGQVKQALVQKKAVLTATVPEDGAAIEFLDEDSAQVLVAVDVTTAVGSSGTDTQRYRTRVKLSQVDDEWRVSGFDQVG